MSPPEKRKEESPVPPVAGERTWTICIYTCGECGTVTLAADLEGRTCPRCHWFPLMSDRAPSPWSEVEVVELSRLRAAEEERERFAEALEIFADEDNWTADAGMNDPPEKRLPLLYGHFQPWELAREVLASLEQKED